MNADDKLEFLRKISEEALKESQLTNEQKNRFKDALDTFILEEKMNNKKETD
jgi:hypothetical protein